MFIRLLGGYSPAGKNVKTSMNNSTDILLRAATHPTHGNVLKAEGFTGQGRDVVRKLSAAMGQNADYIIWKADHIEELVSNLYYYEASITYEIVDQARYEAIHNQ